MASADHSDMARLCLPCFIAATHKKIAGIQCKQHSAGSEVLLKSF